MSKPPTEPADKKPVPSFVRGLFSGVVDDSLIFPFPRLDEEERESLDLVLETFNRFAGDKLDGARFDQEAAIPPEIIQELGELGVLGFTVPEEYGGYGFSTGAYCRLMEAVSRYCASTATIVGGHQSIGIKGLLLYGTEEQKRELLPRMATGEWIGAYCLTEPGSGSDAAAMASKAVYDAKDDVWVLNGRKQWITNGGHSQVLTVFARTEIPGESKPIKRISCFLVLADWEGVSTTPPMHKMGIRGSNTVDIGFDNVRVPSKYLLGEVGAGFKVAMEVLNTGRLSLAAGCIGAAKEMIDAAAEFALERKAFGTTVSQFEMIRRKFAEMMAETYAAEAVVYLTTGLADRGDVDFAMESAISKVFASEVQWRVVNHAVQITGGNGYMAEYPYERFLRDARINSIFEGTNEILRMFIALTGFRKSAAQGTAQMERVHPTLREEAETAAALTEKLAAAVEGAIKTHGRKLPRREYVQERMADAVMDLFAIFASLSRATARLEEAGEEGASRDVKLTRLFTRQAARRLAPLLDQVERNDDPLLDEVSDIAYSDRGFRLS
jgi:acyl-CoA dehydrogenase family protein 9